MKAQMVDLVLVVDASHSMGPCFSQVRQHLADLLKPLQQSSFQVRFGLVAYAAGLDRTGPVYDHTFVGGSGAEWIRKLYSPQIRPEEFFTREPAAIARTLDKLKPQGNEDSLLALDLACDFPFGPLESTRRVIALFSDERLEDGVSEEAPMAKIPALIEKLQQRRIQLFVWAPLSDGLQQLACADRAEVESVDGGDGLKSVDFGRMFEQMGRSISASSLQMGHERDWGRAIFGQDRWPADRFASDATRSVVLGVGESTRLNTAGPLNRINVKLQWSAPVDLDLHAFLLTRDGEEEHVYFAHKSEPSITLDNDAGVGDSAGQNEENITLTSLDRFSRILFAAKIYKKGGSFADYDGRVMVQTSNGDDITVPLTAQQRADWCVIAKIENSAAQGPSVVNVNRVTPGDPDVRSF